MAGYYMLSTLNHLCVCECVGIMPSDEPPPVWSPSSPPGHGSLGSLGSPSILKFCPGPPPGCLDQTLSPWPGGELGDHAGGG